MGLFGKRPPPGPTQQDMLITSLQRHADEAETRYLEVLRREIANMLMVSDQDRFDRLYAKAAAFEAEMARADTQRVEAEEATLIAKFRSFYDFEILGSYHMEPYAEARSYVTDDALAERYQEVCRMLMYLRRRHWVDAGAPVFDQRQWEAQSKFRRRARDQRLRVRIDEAMRLAMAYRRGVTAAGGQDPFDYEDGQYQVFVTQARAWQDTEWAVICLDTGEVGVTAVVDAGDDRRHRFYYRSDAQLVAREDLELS